MKFDKQVSNSYSLAFATVVLGLIIGFAAYILDIELGLVEHLFLGFRERPAEPVSVFISPGHRLLAVFIGGLIVAVIWYFLQRNYKWVTVGQAVQGKREFSGWKTVLDVLTQVFYVSTGGSIGRELAPRELGSMLAQKWGNLFSHEGRFYLSRDDRRLLIAAAAGAGFAGVYLAPITGMMFSIEILRKQISRRAVAVSLTMTAISTTIGSLTKGYKPYYAVSHRNFSFKLIPFTILIALILGILGTIFRKGVKVAKKHQVTDKRILWQLPLAALVTGCVAAVFPQIMGNGRGLAQLAMNSNQIKASVITVLLLGALAKAGVTLLTIKSGAYGGTLTPSISIGAVVGVVLGMVYVQFVPGVDLVQCAIIGAVAFLTASQQAPLMAMFMLVEICHLEVSAMVPLGLGTAISIAISRFIQTNNIRGQRHLN